MEIVSTVVLLAVPLAFALMALDTVGWASNE